MLLVGLYTGVLLMFYAVPLAALLLQSVFSLEWLGLFREVFTLEFFLSLVSISVGLGFFLLLLGLSSTLFVAMPSAMASLYLHSGQRIWRAFAAQYGRGRAWVGSGAMIVAVMVVWMAAQHQPQTQVFDWLNRPAKTNGDRQALLARSEPIRAGLLNAYLANYRYLSSTEANNHIQAMYEQVFALPSPLARSLQWTYNQLMSPFLYQGSGTDVDQAAQHYAQFFDQPIQQGEQAAINHALQSTFNQDEAKAGLLNLNQHKVWLRSQQITVTEQGDWAEVELHEVYENQTPEQQEVFYAFSLPESAVITGLWLGETDNRRERFPFVVAPRGAAQQVYNEQVQRRVDPALIEQVGPRQYRLRAFPIPARSFLRSESSSPARMHLWLTYQVMHQDQGWALPQLAEKRNLYWTRQTQRDRNGQAGPQRLDDWLEPFVPATQARSPQPHQSIFAGGTQLMAQPLSTATPNPAPDSPLCPGARYLPQYGGTWR